LEAYTPPVPALAPPLPAMPPVPPEPPPRVHFLVLKVHCLLQLRVPPGRAPIVTVSHVCPFKFVPSHCSPASSLPFPQVRVPGGRFAESDD
jgi:hypothetical protein